VRSKDSRGVLRGAVGKVPIEATRWRPTLLLVRCGEGLEETYAIKAQGAFILLHDYITALFYEVVVYLQRVDNSAA